MKIMLSLVNTSGTEVTMALSLNEELKEGIKIN